MRLLVISLKSTVVPLLSPCLCLSGDSLYNQNSSVAGAMALRKMIPERRYLCGDAFSLVIRLSLEALFPSESLVSQTAADSILTHPLLAD